MLMLFFRNATIQVTVQTFPFLLLPLPISLTIKNKGHALSMSVKVKLLLHFKNVFFASHLQKSQQWMVLTRKCIARISMDCKAEKKIINISFIQ